MASSRSDRRNGCHGRIVSHAPGRVRVRLPREHRDPTLFERVEQALDQHASITGVTTNARTGSILLSYDGRALSREDVTALLRDVGVIVRDVAGADEITDLPGLEEVGHSSTATSLIEALRDLDRRVSHLTGGRIDVKLLVPASLGLLALRQISLNGLGLSGVPGYVLLWYTFDSFYKLHQRKPEELTVQADAAGDAAGTATGEAGGATPGAGRTR